MQVLVCEDDNDILELIAILLKQIGLTYQTCTNGDKAVKIINEDKPQLVIMDYWLDGLNGDKVIEYMKSKDGFKDIPIILISAVNGMEKVADALKIKDYFQKPFDINDLQAKIKELLNLKTDDI